MLDSHTKTFSYWPAPSGRPSVRSRAVAFIEFSSDAARDAIESALAEAGGEVVQRADGIVLAAFQSVTACHRVGASLPAEARAGFSCGDVLYENGLIYGLPVVEASRLLDAAAPGQVLCISRFVRVGDLPVREFRSVGELEMRGFEIRLSASEVLRR